jgi:hypothetical protein
MDAYENVFKPIPSHIVDNDRGVEKINRFGLMVKPSVQYFIDTIAKLFMVVYFLKSSLTQVGGKCLCMIMHITKRIQYLDSCQHNWQVF